MRGLKKQDGFIQALIPWIPAIAAGIGAIGSFVGGERANAASSAQAGRQMDFQESMSNTAHQREVNDLRSAGLNPILSAQRGSSTPGGAMAQQMDTISPAVNTAMQVSKNAAEVGTIRAQGQKLVQELDLVDANTWKADVEAALISLNYNEKLVLIEILEEELKIRRRMGEISNSDFGVFMGYVKEFTGSVLGGGSLVPN